MGGYLYSEATYPHAGVRHEVQFESPKDLPDLGADHFDYVDCMSRLILEIENQMFAKSGRRRLDLGKTNFYYVRPSPT